MAESSKIIEVLIGHESKKLDKPTANRHTHEWTLFVRPANKDYKDFSDNKFISKVKFQIHESFPNPQRVIREPPFSVTETGYASFSSVITIYLNLHNQKSHKIQYELNLSLGESGYHDEIQKLNIKADIPDFFTTLMNKYCLKRKSKRKSSVINDEKSPPVKKHKKVDEVAKEPSSSSSSSSKNTVYKHPNNSAGKAPFKTNKKKKEESSRTPTITDPKNIEQLTKKILKITDSSLLYDVCKVLLNNKETKLSGSSLSLSFDLKNAPSSILISLSNLLSDSPSS